MPRAKTWPPGAAVTSLDSIEAPVRWAKQNLTDGIWAEGGDPAVAETACQSGCRASRDSGDNRNARTRRAANETASVDQIKHNKNLTRLPQGKMVYAAATHFKPQGNFKPTEGKLRPIHLLHRGDIQSPREPSPPGCLATVAGRRLAVGSGRGRSRTPRGTRPLVDPRRSSAGLAIDCQSSLAVSLWPGNRRHAERLWSHGCPADASANCSIGWRLNFVTAVNH